MKLVDVEYTFDRRKVVFYFTAEQRVDFRELVRDLAHTLKARIELRHIQVRDQAKMVGGIGECGRLLCCRTWLREFMPISMKMAKRQNLSLNPEKISGQCGRLMCCLSYENDQYEAKKKKKKAPATPDTDTKTAEGTDSGKAAEGKPPAAPSSREAPTPTRRHEDPVSREAKEGTGAETDRDAAQPAKKSRRKSRRKRRRRRKSTSETGNTAQTPPGGSS